MTKLHCFYYSQWAVSLAALIAGSSCFGSASGSGSTTPDAENNLPTLTDYCRELTDDHVSQCLGAAQGKHLDQYALQRCQYIPANQPLQRVNCVQAIAGKEYSNSELDTCHSIKSVTATVKCFNACGTAQSPPGQAGSTTDRGQDRSSTNTLKPPFASGRAAMTSSEFKRLLEAINDKNHEEQRIRVMISSSRRYWFTCSQVVRMLETLNHETNRVRVIRFVGRRVVNPQNVSKVESEFNDQTNRDLTRKLIRGY